MPNDPLPLVIAHIVPGVTDFYAGLLHPVTAVEHLLTFTAVGLLAGQQMARVALRALTLFVGALFVSAGASGAFVASDRAAGSWIDVAALLAMIGVGCLVAWSGRLPPPVVYACVVAVAVVHGAANVAEMAPAMSAARFVAGSAIAGFVVATYALGVARRARAPWATIAVRAAGSWIAAVGILAWGAATR
jgi:urease accessory protein